MSDLVTVILAAGKGTRMKSKLPKVLHKAGGKSMVLHVLDAARSAGAKRNIVVTGFGGEMVREALGNQAEFVEQKEQLGTGHAVQQTADLLAGENGTVMVLCGDTPLLTGDLLRKLYDAHKEAGAKATVLTAIMPDATGYGRIIRVELLHKLHDERKYDSLAALTAGIAQDCADARAFFASPDYSGTHRQTTRDRI